MLVLTRKAGQQILIGKGLIQMKVLKVDDDIISIGIKAPQHIDIDREEIYLKKLQQEQAESFMQKVAP
ncbi:carbon storage regulator [Legionella pneumophila serogroup 1]|uniref:carbon storage regulator n=1 Tax=Legionella pneumophila TaxID=446 RepID=UPI001A30D5A8|nr:carbon storage regulator [Legionella pneumophila]HAT9741597.1 carbon storage regulator [Legionella pneumophila subsp. pneumophila]MCH9059807.1 carbon storage regulator [Legionella pneumophila serogroup 1]MCH9071815.1 carbon storage regulator [Legionella pneumophila serogroup 1]MCH9077845.1 carbon storage regulator [Legionella pneumophila serogroup 1]MCH9080769.1 carbon storage regulator [Legionella pneumophila serogroup 1]